VLRGDNEWIEIRRKRQCAGQLHLHTDMGYPLVIGGICTVGSQRHLTLHPGGRCLVGMGHRHERRENWPGSIVAQKLGSSPKENSFPSIP